MAGTGIARSSRSKGRNKKLEVHIFNYKRDGVTTASRDGHKFSKPPPDDILLL